MQANDDTGLNDDFWHEILLQAHLRTAAAYDGIYISDTLLADVSLPCLQWEIDAQLLTDKHSQSEMLVYPDTSMVRGAETRVALGYDASGGKWA